MSRAFTPGCGLAKPRVGFYFRFKISAPLERQHICDLDRNPRLLSAKYNGEIAESQFFVVAIRGTIHALPGSNRLLCNKRIQAPVPQLKKSTESIRNTSSRRGKTC